MALPAPNFDRLSNAHIVISEEAAKFANVPAFDQGVQTLQAIERIEQTQIQMQLSMQQAQVEMRLSIQQMQQAQVEMQQAQVEMRLSIQQIQQAQVEMRLSMQQMQQTQVEMRLSMQQMFDRFETRFKASYVLKLESLYIRSN
jgi:hypothetical protein